MPGVMDRIIKRAKQAPKRVALPECEAVNTLLVARELVEQGIGAPVLVNDPAVIEVTAKEAGVSLDGMEIVDISDEAANDAKVARYIAEPRMLTEKGCRKRLADPMSHAMILEDLGDVDCTFCGHTHTTGDVLVAAQSIIGLAENVDVVSIMAVVESPGFKGPEGDTIVFADCGLNTTPEPESLASIAIAACDQARAILGWEPRCAFISFSTDGSGRGRTVLSTREAIQIAKERRPDLKLDGEFQVDAAVFPEIAASKVKRESEVAGKANILVFPTLDAANVAIKIAQNFAGATGYGHTLNGLRLPVADSSRSATVTEMLGDIAMVVLAAGDN